MDAVQITHIGGPTTLIEAGGWRLLTDPTFDQPGRRYDFGWGTSSRKLVGPAVSAATLGPIDAVLLSHDHHGDNLDDAGRALLPDVPLVLTTRPGARRLGGNARGLAPWATTRLEATGRPTLTITATPARHGPPLSRPVAGAVTGFAIHWPGQEHGQLWMSGDSVFFSGLRQVAAQIRVDTALLHMGGVQFPVTGPVRYSMTGRQAVQLCGVLRPRTAIPVHYEGWQHFREGRDAVKRAFAAASPQIETRLRWLPVGAPVDLST